MSILLDIGGREVLKFEAVFDLLKYVEKEDLFANFPIGATIQDGGKRKRSGLVMCLFIVQKKNQYKIRKIKEKKNKNC